MITRRKLIKRTGQAIAAAGMSSWGTVEAVAKDLGLETLPSVKSQRCINVVNFIRGVEPRGPVDLMLPVQKQMEILLRRNLPATWLLQFDALVSGPFVEFLKRVAPHSHEVGIWFEMNELHCKAANVKWRGRPGYEWDHFPSVAFTIGYSPEERVKLADSFMSEFKSVWGYYPKSIASWNLDSITMAHLSDKYRVDAFAVCRDQIATDGFTIWGSPIAGYYPSKKNCWSPAVSKSNQINVPVLRMLGQDPVYYYERSYPLPDGKRYGTPDTMEPVWPAGRSAEFISNFLAMIEKAPALEFAYAQLGQENNFGWEAMEPAYDRQLKALSEMRDRKKVNVETMGETGRRFKSSFNVTPSQAQVMLQDPFGNKIAERSIWYQSRFYRANLHIKNDLAYLRDITVYSDQNPQPYLNGATTLQDVEQRMPAILDGYHWSANPGSQVPGAAGYFEIDGKPVRLMGDLKVQEMGNRMSIDLPVGAGRSLLVSFSEKTLTVRLEPASQQTLSLSFEWDSNKASMVQVKQDRVEYRWNGFDYSVHAAHIAATPNGWKVTENEGSITLQLSQ